MLSYIPKHTLHIWYTVVQHSSTSTYKQISLKFENFMDGQ